MLLRPAIGPRPPSLLARYGSELARISDRGQADLALAQQGRLERLDVLMRNIVQQSFDGILSIGEDGRVTMANDAACAMFASDDRSGLVGRHTLELFPDLNRFRRVGRLGDLVGAERLEGDASRLDGATFPVELSLRPTVVDRERLTVAIVRDITEAKAQERELRHQAAHDALTGLPNRLFLRSQLGEALTTARTRHEPLGLLLLDLDRFKEINDTLGHHVGDLLLTFVAKRLRACLRGHDLIARLGGDEFAILLPPPSGVERAWSVAERVVEAVRQPFEVLNGLRLEVGISIGIALFPEHGDEEARLLQGADVAMYAAKRGATSIGLYDPEQDHNTVRHLTLSGALRMAIEGGELSFVYQPKLDLKTGAIGSVEALARWQHPQQGAILPDEFIPHAERTGLIRPLTRWSFEAVLAQLAAWQDHSPKLSVALNLSACSVHEESLPDMVAELLAKWRVDPGRLTIELTESAVMLDPSGARTNLLRLHEIGVRLSIDDFGTGYSSLSHLQRLPLDELKIDKSFVAHMEANEQDLMIVRSTIDLAHNLGLTVVAEGMETVEHLRILRRLGCDQAQGYLVAEPQTADRLAAWFRQSPSVVDGIAARGKPRRAPRMPLQVSA